MVGAELNIVQNSFCTQWLGYFSFGVEIMAKKIRSGEPFFKKAVSIKVFSAEGGLTVTIEVK